MRIQDIEKEFGKPFVDLIRDYCAKGKTSSEIAVCLGCAPSTIRNHASKNGIKLPSKKWQSKLIYGD